MKCEGKVALVTGAAGSGLGRSIALTLAREGARVIVNYRNSRANAEAIVAHIESYGGSAQAVSADVFTAEGCQELVQTTVERFGQIDICIIGPGGGWHPEAITRLCLQYRQSGSNASIAPSPGSSLGTRRNRKRDCTRPRGRHSQFR